MDTAIKIQGGESSADTVAYASAGIAEIFRAGFETRQPESVMLAALSVFGKSVKGGDVAGVSISNVNVRDDSVTRSN